MSTINSSKDVSKAIENVLTQLRDKNKCPNLEDLYITKLQDAKNWIDRGAMYHVLKDLRSAYKKLAQEVLNNLVDSLESGEENKDNNEALNDVLLKLIFRTIEMEDYSIPEYGEILGKIMKKLSSENRKYAEKYYGNMVDHPDEFRNAFEKIRKNKIEEHIFINSITSLKNAAKGM